MPDRLLISEQLAVVSLVELLDLFHALADPFEVHPRRLPFYSGWRCRMDAESGSGLGLDS